MTEKQPSLQKRITRRGLLINSGYAATALFGCGSLYATKDANDANYHKDMIEWRYSRLDPAIQPQFAERYKSFISIYSRRSNSSKMDSLFFLFAGTAVLFITKMYEKTHSNRY